MTNHPTISLQDLTALLHAEIPLTRAMQFSLTSFDNHTLTLTAPLAPNQNHTDTAFGGAISSLGILAGYALLFLLLHNKNLSTRILIQKSSTDFLRPIDSVITATASLPDPAILEEFLSTLTRKRKARLPLDSKILSNTSLAATHTGLFVAILY